MAGNLSADRTDPFQLGYLAGADTQKVVGARSPLAIQQCPYPPLHPARRVWLDGWTEWQRDLAAGMTPPSWRI